MPSSRIDKAMGVVTSDLTEFETYTPSLDLADFEQSQFALPSMKALYARIEQGNYLRKSWYDRWLKTAAEDDLQSLWSAFITWLFKPDLWREIRLLRACIRSPEATRKDLNHCVMVANLQRHQNFFDEVEKHPLTQTQRIACVADEDANLVVAGAGTGKTSTIIAKIGILLRSGEYRPDELLAISYTNKSAQELAERIRDKLNADVRVATFHKLGLSILAQGPLGKPRLAAFAADSVEKGRHISAIIETLKQDSEFRGDYLNFCAYNLIDNKSIWHFNSLAEYKNWLSANRIMSLDGVPKNSNQERLIANWLILNGVRFEYEHPYEHRTSSPDRRQYQPDFWLPDINVYIEHFGIDEQGNTASFINRSDYHAGIEWKRRTHRQYRTRLIETYSWQQGKGTLLSGLKAQLERHGCKFQPISEEKALDLLNAAGNTNVYSTLVAGFLTLYKGNGGKLASGIGGLTVADIERETLFLRLFKSIHEAYEAHNRRHDQIDFEDMIVRASDLAKSGDFKSPYRYILIDEFQDISPGRAELIKNLRDATTDGSVFAVGDDWQSIYRFAGSDIGEMTRFDDAFGTSRKVALDKTFRFDQNLVEVSSQFILKNPAQIQKNIQSDRAAPSPSVTVYQRPPDEPPLQWVLKEIERQSKGDASVLVLERYTFHLPQDPEWRKHEQAYPTLKMQRMTIHGAKGLEADFVVVGLRGGYWGFPSQIIDDPILNLVLHQSDGFPHGEERRLFYVALTRAKKKTFVICETGADESVFTAELIKGPEYPVAVQGLDTAKLGCKKCGSGTMLLRDGSNGRFYGCSNYPFCTHTDQVCGSCLKGLLILNEESGTFECHLCKTSVNACPSCGSGILQLKNGAFGSFMGCSNYWDPDIACKYKDNVTSGV